MYRKSGFKAQTGLLISYFGVLNLFRVFQLASFTGLVCKLAQMYVNIGKELDSYSSPLIQ